MNIEQTILEKLQALSLEKQCQVLTFVDSLLDEREQDIIEELLVNPLEPSSDPRPFTRAELYD